MAKQRRVMQDFRLVELSGVDRPAQQDAKVTLMKRYDEGEFEKKETKREDGKDFTASDYAYVPDPEKSSTWKLRLTSTPGGEPDAGIVGAAAAALGPGFRGQKVEIPSDDRSAVVSRVRAAWRKANPDKEDDDMPEGIKKSDEETIAEGIAKYYIDPMDGAKPFNVFLEECIENDRYWEVMNEAGEYVSALNSSLRSIIGDSNLSTADKESMMRNSVEEFLTSIRAKWPDVEQALMKVIEEEGVDNMNKRGTNENANEDLEKKVEELTKNFEDVQKKLEAAEKKATEAEEKLKTANDELETAKAKGDMSDDERSYMDALEDDKAKKEFMAMKPEDRKKAMKKREADDEIIKVDGVGEVRKSVVGEAQFGIFKAQQERFEKQEEELKKQRERAETAEYTKRAEDELNHLPGEVSKKATVLKAVDEIKDEETRKSLTEMLKAGDKAISAAYTTIGHRGEETKKVANDFNKRVDEIAARDKISKMDAMRKARTEYPDEYKAYQEAPASN